MMVIFALLTLATSIDAITQMLPIAVLQEKIVSMQMKCALMIFVILQSINAMNCPIKHAVMTITTVQHLLMLVR
jgi:hypothetical protein